MLKESRYLLFKRQNGRKMCRVFAWFSTFCMSLPYICPILAQTIKLRKDKSKIINSSFSQLVCVYERLLEVKISGIYSKLKATYVFVFVGSAILDVSILSPKISTRYHVYDCVFACFGVSFCTVFTFFVSRWYFVRFGELSGHLLGQSC